MDPFLGQKTQGQLIYEAALRDARRNYIWLAISRLCIVVGTIALVWLAFFR